LIAKDEAIMSSGTARSRIGNLSSTATSSHGTPQTLSWSKPVCPSSS